MAMCVFCVERAETSRSRFTLADCWQQHSCSSLCRVTFWCMLSLVNSTHYNHVHTHHDSARCHRFKQKQDKWFQTESSTFPIAWSSYAHENDSILVYNFFYRKLRSWHFLLFSRFLFNCEKCAKFSGQRCTLILMHQYLIIYYVTRHHFWSKHKLLNYFQTLFGRLTCHGEHFPGIVSTDGRRRRRSIAWSHR